MEGCVSAVQAVPGKPVRPPRLPFPARSVKASKCPPPLEICVEPVDGAGPDDQQTAFNIATPRGGDADVDISRHFIGTPTASSILSAFLDFDEADTTGPPLDPEDYCAVGNHESHEPVKAPPLEDEVNFAELSRVPSKRRPRDGSFVSNCSTRLADDSRAGSLASSGGEQDEDVDEAEAAAKAKRKAVEEEPAEAEEHYEDDFECESDAESEDDAEVRPTR
eukprot:TRINITY_DN45610_c0_g1_i1.p1 TRINITY_DN45610_c0_g1~~TRINITY_DN45610_c0_g1_i1.p1  ORF type:complete len:221 (-),score=56.65 TRINITY_DN45610_c0_g1_i1:91-753(-)